MGTPLAVSSRHNEPKLFPLGRARVISRLNGSLSHLPQINFKESELLWSPAHRGRNQGNWEDPLHPHLTPDTDHMAECGI